MSDFQNQLTNNTIKLIRSLQQKKFRYKNGLFVAEGIKIVAELLKQDRLIIQQIFATEDWLQNSDNFSRISADKVTKITEQQLKKISNLQTPNQVLALVEIPNLAYTKLNEQKINIALDDIRDPGNLGAIIRIADWFGLHTIYCSLASVDCFNAKVIQSAMGSLFRVKVVYTDLEQLFQENNKLAVFGTFMDGENINSVNWKENGFLLMGNEANGIGKTLKNSVSHKVSIPRLGDAESLNLSVATGIFVHKIVGI